MPVSDGTILNVIDPLSLIKLAPAALSCVLSEEGCKVHMSSSSVLDKTYHIIIQRMTKTGQAPHYTEIAAELGIPVEEGRKALHDLISVGIPGIWLFPDTDYIGSFAPFSNLPTQYRITVDGEQKWFGQ
jgi:hypothetical protein